MQPKVSILIPVYNDEAFIEDLLESIHAQTFTDFECLFYLHGSSDKSGELLRKHIRSDKRFRVIEAQKNIGNGATNKLIREAKGQYIKLFCADDKLLPHCLEKQVSFLDSPQGAPFDVLFAKHYSIFPNGKKEPEKNPAVNRSRTEFLRDIFYKIHVGFAFPTVMFRASVIDERPLIDERFGQINDIHLWIRLLLEGHSIYKLDEHLIEYRFHNNNVSNINRITNKARLIFEFNQILNLYTDKITSIQELNDIFPEAKPWTQKLAPSDTDLIPFVICQLALNVTERIFPFLEFHQNFATSKLFDMFADPQLAQRISDTFDFSFNELKDTTLKNPNGLELAYFFREMKLDYTLLKRVRGLFGLPYRLKRKRMKNAANRLLSKILSEN